VNRPKAAAPNVQQGKVYCPICTHTVEADIQHEPKHSFVKPGQKCPRCSGSLDAGYIFPVRHAA
jgi:hypothetical protein